MHQQETPKPGLPQQQEVIHYYKVNPCNQSLPNTFGEAHFHGQLCTQPLCFGYHNLGERRRPLIQEDSANILYQPAMCSSMIERGVCAKGDFCKFSHTQNEYFYHPLFYKTESCAGCSYQGSNARFCPYYHADEGNRKNVLEKFKGKTNKDESKNPSNTDENDQNPFDLDSFKANPCPFKTNHNPKVCEYYHHDKDRKRPVSSCNYSPNLCSYAEKGKPCPRGDNCTNCHNKVEQLYHPERYKRKFCLAHPHSIHKCEYGNFCSFAHNESEILIELLHNIKKDENFYLYKYKTVFCPYIYDHDRNQCVYAHNPQDYRRDPSLYNYNPVQCPSWSKGQIYSYEEGACPQQMGCDHCHGWKELEFHPMYYKTKPCNNGKKCNKKDCPFYHLNTEKRDPQTNSQPSANFSALKISANTNSSKKNDPNENDVKLSSESSKQKISQKKDSHYGRPIMPTYTPLSKESANSNQQGGSEIKSKRAAEPSTRANSNISTGIYFSGEDVVRVVPPKKKKGKRMSLQNQKEKLVSPLSAKSDKPKGQMVKDMPAPFVNIWECSNQENHEKLDTYFNNFESNKPLNRSRGNDSFDDSLQSFTVEKNVGNSDKPVEIANDQFIYTLFSNLERKGLEHTIQHLRNPSPDVELLKTLSAKDFHLYPQINFEDKERIVKIIQDILEEEAILSEINTVNEGGFATPLAQNNVEDNGIYANFDFNTSSHEFSITNFFQKYS